MTITDLYIKVNRKIEAVEKFLAVTLISAIVLIVFASTVARYVFKEPLFGADRLATYLMVWLGFIGFQIATSKLRHIELEFIRTKVSDAIKYKLNIITSLVAAIFLSIMFVLSLSYLQASMTLEDKDIVLGIPLWMIIIIIPVSFCISAIRYFFSIFLWKDVLKGKRRKEDIVKKQLI
ncbi:TRAP transporter small permease [Candidatus Amoebophilus asiaticus]|nr:TRAP transporter small permease [Candidatus Amoebophilus asiaticus]